MGVKKAKKASPVKAAPVVRSPLPPVPAPPVPEPVVDLKTFALPGPSDSNQTPSEPVETRTVAELLKASITCHNEARPRNKGFRPEGWERSIAEASKLRQAALRLDPGMTDPAWLGAGDHAGMVAFYADIEGRA